MTTFAAALRKWQSVDIDATAGEAMKENESEILDVNREQLYELGIGKDGKELPPYTPQYARLKQRIRGRSIVDIYKTGRLQAEMQLNVSGGEYDINSVVPYAKYVAGRRPTIFGLTEEGKRETWTIIHPDFVQKIKELTGAG